jgi:hypothetical protein
MNRQMLPDLPLWMWLAVAAIPVTFVCLAVLVWVFAVRASARDQERRFSMIAQFLAPRGSHLSAERADRERVDAALVELNEGGTFDIYWVAASGSGTLFEYTAGVRHRRRGYGYLERSPFPGLTASVTVSPRTRWLGADLAPTFRFGREVGEGWANPEFHKRYQVVARDAAEGSRVVTSRLQFLLLDLPDVNSATLDWELVEIAVDGSHWTVLGRKWDWGTKKIGDGFPDIESHLRLAGRIRDALGR